MKFLRLTLPHGIGPVAVNPHRITTVNSVGEKKHTAICFGSDEDYIHVTEDYDTVMTMLETEVQK